MEIWTVVISLWLSTWLMAVSRTYSLIMYMAKDYEGGKLIREYKKTHAVIYAVSMIFIAPFIWQICFFEEPRRNFVVSYVNAIIRDKT